MPQEIRSEGLIAFSFGRPLEDWSTSPVNQIFVSGGQDYVIDLGTFSAGSTYTVATPTADLLMQQHHDDRPVLAWSDAVRDGDWQAAVPW